MAVIPIAALEDMIKAHELLKDRVLEHPTAFLNALRSISNEEVAAHYDFQTLIKDWSDGFIDVFACIEEHTDSDGNYRYSFDLKIVYKLIKDSNGYDHLEKVENIDYCDHKEEFFDAKNYVKHQLPTIISIVESFIDNSIKLLATHASMTGLKPEIVSYFSINKSGRGNVVLDGCKGSCWININGTEINLSANTPINASAYWKKDKEQKDFNSCYLSMLESLRKAAIDAQLSIEKEIEKYKTLIGV